MEATKTEEKAFTAPETKLHFLDYWRIIRIRKTVILAVFLLVSLTTTVVTFMLPESYSSTVQIKIDKDAPDVEIGLGRDEAHAFADEVKNRITRFNFDTNGDDIFLRLRREDGPILDGSDVLADVIDNPRTENIVVTSRRPDPRNVDPGIHLVSLTH